MVEWFFLEPLHEAVRQLKKHCFILYMDGKSTSYLFISNFFRQMALTIRPKRKPSSFHKIASQTRNPCRKSNGYLNC